MLDRPYRYSLGVQPSLHVSSLISALWLGDVPNGISTSCARILPSYVYTYVNPRRLQGVCMGTCQDVNGHPILVAAVAQREASKEVFFLSQMGSAITPNTCSPTELHTLWLAGKLPVNP